MKLRATLIQYNWLLSSQFGIDLLRFLRSFLGISRYLRDWLRFRKEYSGVLTLMPCLHDWQEEGGVTKSEYFWQDLLVARMIFDTKPTKHVDIGSRVDGFVAHVASYREIEVFDMRHISTEAPNVTFRQADLMQQVVNENSEEGYCDSLSCLHALEHFGLGRYGDPIDVHGYERGIENMAKLIKTGGIYYLSIPIGIERVEFNANRVFDPNTIIRCAEANCLNLQKLTVVSAGKAPVDLNPTDAAITELANRIYSLGIFVFVKSELYRK